MGQAIRLPSHRGQVSSLVRSHEIPGDGHTGIIGGHRCGEASEASLSSDPVIGRYIEARLLADNKRVDGAGLKMRGEKISSL